MFMQKLENKLNKIISTLAEETATSWKDFNNPEYDRQSAEDALYHTIGPLTDNPKWANKWTSTGGPPPEFTPGGPAPRWTPEEIVYAYAGDPALLMGNTKDNPRSPKYGSLGGAPLYRSATKIARKFNRRDPQFVADLYSNGFIPLVQMMKPGYDESRSPFIPYVTRNVLSAMEGGIGGTERHIRALAGDSQTGTRGIESLLNAQTGDEAIAIADQVKGEYRYQSKHDKTEDNPFGQFSNEFYDVAMQHAQALDSGDEDQIQQSKESIQNLSNKIEDSRIHIPGASTGLGQAISVGDRKTKLGLASIDKAMPGSDNEASMAQTISTDEHEDNWISPESVRYILNIGLTQDMNSMVGDMEEFKSIARSAGSPDGKIGGKLTANELRYIIRYLGPIGSNYPGIGVPRSNVKIARDAAGWWKPGEDPEIEPLADKDWSSIWSRSGYPEMGPTEIASEMTRELYEFKELGIRSARLDKLEGGKASAVSKVAVSNTTKAALIKLKVIAAVYREELGINESKYKKIRPILESVDRSDRILISEACELLYRKIRNQFVSNWFK